MTDPSDEPKVLMIGRAHPVMSVLIGELENFGRVVRAATSAQEVREALEAGVDLVVMGAGIPDDKRAEMAALVASIDPAVSVHLIERGARPHPRNMIAFVNERVIDHKLNRVLPDRTRPSS